MFDSFPDRPQSVHGGAKFDEGFNLQEKGSPKGEIFDEFGTPATTSAAHGVIWDEWGWKDMPDIHGGLLYDEGFGDPAANTGSRGPLFDLFEPSTQVKFIYDGQDAEGIVDQVRGDGVVMVTPRKGGKPVEVGLSQFLSYRSPSMDNAGTTAEHSEAQAPSGMDATAHGGGILAGLKRTEGGEELGPVIDSVSEGPGNPDPRGEESIDWSPVDHLKSTLGDVDVRKAGNEHEFRLHNSGDRLARHIMSGPESHQQGDMHKPYHVLRLKLRDDKGQEAHSYSVHHNPGAGREGRHLGTHPSGAHAAFAIHEHAKRQVDPTEVTLHGDLNKSESSPLDVLKGLGGADSWSQASGHLKEAMRTASGGGPHYSKAWAHLGKARDARVGGSQLANYHAANAHQSTQMGNIAERAGGTPNAHGEQAEALLRPHAHKVAVGDGDVAKEHVGFDAMVAKLEAEGHPAEHAKRIAASIGRKKFGEKGMEAKAHAAEKTYMRLPSGALVEKEVTVAETAIQAENGRATLAGGEGAGSYCPECRKRQKLTADGRCPDCNMALGAHEAGRVKREKGDGNGAAENSSKTLPVLDDLRKAFGAGGDSDRGGTAGVLNSGTTSDGTDGTRGQQKGQATSWPNDVPMDAREHKESDHNSETTEEHSAGTTCPHCGQPIAELDRKTEQGAPAHKCLEGLLSVAKARKQPPVPESPLDALKALTAA